MSNVDIYFDKMETEGVEELLFFETFSHDTSEEINLDLVQFPKPVIITEIRIIPLGARVQADFPGGVRLGATNPSQFHTEFFVNDLSKHGTSTFECLGALEYKQTSDIQFQCAQKKIPTDGLVLRGWYTTITLAVYGGLSAGIPPLPVPDPRAELSASAATAEWVQSQQAAMYLDPPFSYPPPDFPPAPSQHPYVETWNAPATVAAPPIGLPDAYDPGPKDYGTPPNWEPPPEEVKPWPETVRIKDDAKAMSSRSSNGGDSAGRSRREFWDERDDRKGKRYKEGSSRGRSKSGREGSWDREKSPYSDSNYRRRPKSPPSHSPKRPYTPTERFWSPERPAVYRSPSGRYADERRPQSPAKLRMDLVESPAVPLESPSARPQAEGSLVDEEQFEPILSDEDIVDESESQFPEMDYDFPDDVEEVVKPFHPYNYTVSALKNIPDPSLSACETLSSQIDKAGLHKTQEILEMTIEPTEEWITAIEQLIFILPKVFVGDIDEKLRNRLFEWVEEGLTLEAALRHTNPGAKIRHIKTVIRLVEVLCQCKLSGELSLRGLQRRLLKLFYGEHMTLSIRLLILQALDMTLIDHVAMKQFHTEEWDLQIGEEVECCSSYQHILRMLVEQHQTRIKFSLNSLLQKVHVEELLDRLQKLTSALTQDNEVEDRDLVDTIEAVRFFYSQPARLAQPRRYLPVSAQFEVSIDPVSSYHFLYRYFRKHCVLEALVVLLTKRECGQTVPAAVYELLREISNKRHGLAFLSSSSEATTALLKALQTAEEYNEHDQTGCQLAADLPFRLHVLELVDRLINVEEEEIAFSAVHDLFCTAMTSVGKLQASFVLAMDDNLHHLLSLGDRFGRKSAVWGYVGDLAAITIRYSDSISYLRGTNKQLVEILSDSQSKMADLVPVVKLAETLLDDVPGLCALLKQLATADFNVSSLVELVTVVRILKSLCVPPTGLLDDCSVQQLTELRYKHATLQLYSLDGLTSLTTIMTKIVEYYEQPFVHYVSFLGAQGYALFSFLSTGVLLMRRMLTFLIEARGQEYKDLTHVATLIEVYTLAQAVPASAEAHSIAQNVFSNVVETLLAYTQPSAQIENFAKSLWTLMLSEVVKFTIKLPYCIMSGFSLLAELLPLPLPVCSRSPLSDQEIEALRNVRQLWSAHLHPLAGVLHDLLATLASSSLGPLMEVMRRVATQLADLAAPTALIVARAILDPLLATLTKPSGGWEIPITHQAARLLQFLSCLVTNASIKAAVLSLITPGANARTDEKLILFGDALSKILRTPGSTVSHTQAQEHVVFLTHTLLDPEVALLPHNGNPSGLANALPARELISTMVAALVDHLSAPDHPLHTLVHVLKALLLFTDHDYGFYHLKAALSTQSEAVWKMISRLRSEVARENADALNALHFTFTLMRELKLDTPTPVRTLTLTKGEIAKLLRWGTSEGDEQAHPLTCIHQNLKEWSATDESLGNLFLSADNAINSLSDTNLDASQPSVKEEEPVIGPSLPLMEQFALRPIFITGEPELKTLSSAYWLCAFPLDDVEQDSEQIPCDILELCSSLLPNVQLHHEVQRICRLKLSDVDDDGKKPVASKYQLAGMRTKRPFIAPMRGRGGRAPAQRGDLFRSRPPNTSRPPSLHVDDFVALETCGQQPTGPTGYNKVSVRNVKDVIGPRGRGRGRGFGAPPYPRRDSPRTVSRGRGAWNHDDLRATTRFRPWPTEDLRRIHPFPR